MFVPGGSGALAFTVAEPEQARQLALSVSGALAIWARKHSAINLVEVRREPTSLLTSAELRDLLVARGSPTFRSGSGLTRADLELLPQGIRKFATDHGLREAFCGLDLSDAFVEMGLGPFETFIQDLEARSETELDLDYLVNRHRYELSFIAVFKGIEALLGGMQLRKHQVVSRLEKKGLDPKAGYTPAFERGAQPTTLEDALETSLQRRNAVAAHANLTPPKQLRITLDVVAQARALLLMLFRRVLGPPVKSKLPSIAFLP